MKEQCSNDKALSEITDALKMVNPPEEILSLDDFEAMKTTTNEDGVEVFYFDDFVYSPSGSFGMISLNKTYRKIQTQEGGADIEVQLEVLDVTKINSHSEIVGLEIMLNLKWEDNRIIWTFGGPKEDQEFEFDTKVLRYERRKKWVDS